MEDFFNTFFDFNGKALGLFDPVPKKEKVIPIGPPFFATPLGRMLNHYETACVFYAKN